MSTIEQQTSAAQPQEQAVPEKASSGPEKLPPPVGNKRKLSKETADFTPKTVFGDVAL